MIFDYMHTVPWPNASGRLKKQNGVYFTKSKNPFHHLEFIRWAKQHKINQRIVLEPFAGANDIIKTLRNTDLCNQFSSYDLNPKDDGVKARDSIENFPKGYEVCITNPPWLYKSRAKRLKLPFPETRWDNVYKHCLNLALDHCDYVAILIPASFLSSNIFLERLESVIVIQSKIFEDTENPVCLALFGNKPTEQTKIFADEDYIGTLDQLKKNLPKENNKKQVTFNVSEGDLGLIAIDNTKSASIKFCKGEELNSYDIRHSSRSITRLSIEGVGINQKIIDGLNDNLSNMRKRTHDVFMTPFKGMRKDGMYRRRLDYSMARNLIGQEI